MAHWVRPLGFSNGAPMARWRAKRPRPFIPSYRLKPTEMHKRAPPDRNAEKQRRYRLRLAKHQIVTPVDIDERIISFLVKMRWLAEPDACRRARIGDAIRRLIEEAAEHCGST
jgi:hypothetical protein